ncbi:hypothetical protein L8R73_13290 [Enterobacter bugandensis]|uniref:hypothetical protein n=1 Tax=Enterobacter bugandensis TaxID=881260 RepID=UPI0020046FBB|nr:hypothetical protein [Enterobacter bugandensis]MCK6810640.1 hypothetical protein [Enterobacter bugandensis]
MKNESAFPVPATEYHGMDSGMTLRDYFAAKAMQGWLASFSESDAHPSVSGKCDAVAEASYELADAMLKAREA